VCWCDCCGGGGEEVAQVKEEKLKVVEKWCWGIAKGLIFVGDSQRGCDGSFKGRKWVFEWFGVYSWHSKGP